MDSAKKYDIEPQRILSFCYGYGGLDKGVNRVLQTEPVAYVEIEAFQNFNLVAAMEAGLVDKAPIWTDLKTFDGKPFCNRIHGIIGGYPCQGESTAGKRKLWNDPRFLWPYIERSIKSVNPFWCFFENVSGHLSGSFPYVLESLRDLGYQVEAGLFTASEVGAPHQRKRIFILALDYAYLNELQKICTRRLDLERNTLCNSGRKENTKRFVETSKSLDDTANNRFNRETKSTKIKDGKKKSRVHRELSTRSERPGQELGNTKSTNEQWLFEQSKESQSSFRRYGYKMANTNSFRGDKSKQKTKSKKSCETGNQWPSKPKHQQFEWEEPRAVKPGVGCTVNGYNFRTELLRQYGNGVVEQQAAYAFEILLNKHFENVRNTI